jgi:hypothetical protein
MDLGSNSVTDRHQLTFSLAGDLAQLNLLYSENTIMLVIEKKKLELQSKLRLFGEKVGFLCFWTRE